MKTGKISFKNIKDILSRDEMKSVMAGSGGEGCGNCNSQYGVIACSTGPVTGTCFCAGAFGNPPCS
jgi:hypothetical protein